jgi:hypothetical protein
VETQLPRPQPAPTRISSPQPAGGRYSRLPPMPEHGLRPREKHGPALAGHGATAVRDAITRTMTRFPQRLRQSLTWDHGTEMAQHLRLRIDTGLRVYFCDPQSPWQRGTNENNNGLLRQYFPKGTDLSRYSPNDLEAVSLALNTRPRKTLGWLTPAEAPNEVLKTKHGCRRLLPHSRQTALR